MPVFFIVPGEYITNTREVGYHAMTEILLIWRKTVPALTVEFVERRIAVSGTTAEHDVVTRPIWLFCVSNPATLSTAIKGVPFILPTSGFEIFEPGNAPHMVYLMECTSGVDSYIEISGVRAENRLHS